MIIGFTGTQQGMTSKQKAIFSEIVLGMAGEFHHGDCIGADKESHDIINLLNHYKTVGHLPDKDDKRAFCYFDEIRDPKPYLERNKDIVNECDLLIACPKTAEETIRSGTWSTVRYARKVGKSYMVITP